MTAAAPGLASGAPPPEPGRAARDLVAVHRRLAEQAADLLAYLDGTRADVVRLVEADRDVRVRRELAEITIDRLNEVTDKNLRVRALLDAGYTTVLPLLEAQVSVLQELDGVGPHTARGAVAAAHQLADAIRASLPTRIEMDPTDETSTTLLALLDRVRRLGPLVEAHREELSDYTRAMASLLPLARPATRRLAFALSRRRTKDAAATALAALPGWDAWLASTGLRDTVARLTATAEAPVPGPVRLWDDFELRAASYYAVLATIVPWATESAAAHGMLPDELADRVGGYPLDESLLRAHLRGYQAFGAKFVLNQGRVLLGDEMGLGKTVQAIAAMADCAAKGDTHFVVVCPASVLVSWVREVGVHSHLAAHRVHGSGRDQALADWTDRGGVAVTTFDGLKHLPLPPGVTGDAPAPSSVEPAPIGDEPVPAAGPRVAMLVVDEAHLIKNPRAQRTRDVLAWVQRCWRVLYMSGTPMENRLEEFLALVSHLQPDVVDRVPRHVGLAGADAFRAAMSGVYLRRNQVEVLVELPDLVEVDEWEELTPAGRAVYADAVASGNLMAMRRAAFATADPAESSKLGRLVEILGDAAENGHKVVVFSFFRQVIELVAASAAIQGRPVHGPITGDVPAGGRQQIVDDFTAAPAGAVLVAQIQAGGVGLNIQAASVVVLCEPALTPAAEDQAVARVRRMGQVRTVRVHRLLAEDSVDERIRELLAEKSQLFDAYVRESSLAAGAVRAVDVSEAQLARQVVTAEQARLGYGPVWDELEASISAVHDDDR